jgi:hypothetical protein
VKESSHEELEDIFDKFSKYHIKIFIRDFSVSVGRKDCTDLIWKGSISRNQVR